MFWCISHKEHKSQVKLQMRFRNLNEQSLRAVRIILNQHERNGAYMIPTEIRSYMRSNTFVLLFILSCTCGGSFPKPSTTRGYMPTPLQRAAHVVRSDNTTSKQHSANTEIHTGAQSRIQLTCRFSWWQGCLMLSFGSTPCEMFSSLSARSRRQIRVHNLLFFLAHLKALYWQSYCFNII